CEQVRFNRQFQNVHGSSFFSAKHIKNNVKNFADSLRLNLYRYPALPPTMPWKDSIPPLPPKNLAAVGNLTGITLTWEKPDTAIDGERAKYFVIYKAVEPETIDVNNPKYILKILPNDTTVYQDYFAVQFNKKYRYIVTSVDRLHNESAPTAKVEFMLTSVSDIAENVFEYNLFQNYPNPFNPSTKIEFTIKTKSYTELKVFDVLGREIQTLVAQELDAGKHSFEFDGTNLPSGIYFYRLSSGEFVQTKKMILQK
ncbi:MAG: T9SS type A sorting domain-containing protein, partial [Ignavibacteria bacterium]|nr:T9SS type A sorting domain-containing protein [Ignavibacteria bacterium]